MYGPNQSRAGLIRQQEAPDFQQGVRTLKRIIRFVESDRRS